MEFLQYVWDWSRIWQIQIRKHRHKEMKFENILSDLAAKKFAAVYFLTGEEAFFIDRITDYISQNILPKKIRPLISMFLR